jgi:hypothetical protein
LAFFAIFFGKKLAFFLQTTGMINCVAENTSKYFVLKTPNFGKNIIQIKTLVPGSKFFSSFLLKTSENHTNVALVRGAIFFIGMSLWGAQREKTLSNYSATTILPTFVNALGCKHHLVSAEKRLKCRLKCRFSEGLNLLNRAMKKRRFFIEKVKVFLSDFVGVGEGDDFISYW